MRSPATSISVRAGRREVIALVVVGAALAIAPQLLGGVYPWGILIISTLAAIALATTIWVNQGRTQLRGPLWAVALLALAWTVVQALPLPCGVVRLLAPESVEQLERVHVLFDRSPPTFCTISRAPSATRQEIVKGLALLCMFASATILVQLGQRRNLLRVVAAAGALLALVALAHALTGATQVFGLYTPVETRDQIFVAPLINLNSLGGFLALCWPVAIAFAITTRDARERVFWLAVATLLAITVLMTRSRGAIGALAIELVIFAVLGLRVGARRTSRAFATPQERLGVGLAIGLVIAVSVYSSYREVVVEFQGGAWDKLVLIKIATGFALEHFWTGIGRGAFASAFASVHNSGVRRFDYAENFVVQWAAEWGTPLTIALLAVIGLALVSSVRKASTWERCAAIAGTLGLALQNLVDLGFELLAVSLLAAAALACAVADRTNTAPVRAATFRTGLSALALATVAAALTLGPSLMREYPSAVDARVRAAIAKGSRERVMEEVAVGMFAYPSEPSFALLAASDALRRNDPRAGRWINRALQLAPGWATAHAMAATWLWNGGHHKQALLELAAAARADIYGIGQARSFTCRIAQVWMRGILSVAAKTSDPALFLELISGCEKLTSAQHAELDHGLLHYDPKSARARLRESERARSAGQLERALALVRQVEQDHPDLPAAIVAESNLLLQMNRLSEARAAIARGIRIAPTDRSVREVELQILTKLGDRGALTRAFSALRGNAEDAHELAMLYHREAAIEVALGNPGAALRAYQQAYDIAAEPDSLRALASTARSMGDVNRARRLYAQLCAMAPDDVASCASAKATEHPSNSAQISGGR
jgi:hypothetical protein